MSEQPIYARARPSSISLAEEYRYEVFISGNPAIQPVGQADGEIEITVTYDGYESFGREACEDVRDHLEEATDDVDAVIGHLALAAYQRTDLDALLDLSTRPSSSIPIAVPVRNAAAGLTELKDLQDDRHVCTVCQAYRPGWPESIPLQISIDLLDEETLREATESAREEVEGRSVSVWDMVARQSGFRENLWLLVNVQLDLPERLISGEEEVEEVETPPPMLSVTEKPAETPAAARPAGTEAEETEPQIICPRCGASNPPDAVNCQQCQVNLAWAWEQAEKAGVGESEKEAGETMAAEEAALAAVPEASAEATPLPATPVTRYPVLAGPPGRRVQARPRLVRMSLQWPTAVSYHNVQLHIEGEESRVPVYDPDRGVIEWGDIDMDYQGPAEGTDLHSFRAPTMILLVNQPGELYQVNTLEGEVEVELPGALFSGMQARYFDARGYLDTESPFEMMTIFRGRITLIPEERFRRRVFSPYQRLEFEGVILDEMRLTDIRTILQDHRFRDIRARQLSADGDRLVYGIEGTRMEGPDSLVLRVYAVGTFATTERKTEIPGGRIFTTPRRTGDTVIYMRGELRGSSSRLSSVMNDIHRALKARFRHVAVE